MFTYSTERAFDPAEAKFINNIKAYPTVTITHDNTSPDGKFRRLSGHVGGY